MIHTLENSFLRVQILDHGAELCSIYDREKGREVLWQADPAYWKRHAPVLFPNVGKHYGNHYRVNGTEYPSKQHGFARDMEFTCVKEDTQSVTHKLVSTAATKEEYPFDFELEVCHTLRDRTLTVEWHVTNAGKEPMYFTIGGHPAFRVPVVEGTKQTDYRLSFNGEESLSYLLLDPASGTAKKEETMTLALENGTCSITEEMFDRDALVFDHQIQRAGILMPDGSPYLEVRCVGFPNFGIWAAPNAPFVCLEPWMGRCDDCGFDGELKEKADINILDPNAEFEKSYTIEIF